MSGERIVGTALLAVTLVFGLALCIMPLGETWVEDPDTGTRQTETYGMFAKVRETTPAGEAADGAGTRWFYADGGLDDTGGITFLRIMGPLMAAALVLTVVAFVLTVVPRTSQRRVGGWFALPAAAMFLTSIVLVVLGTAMHAASLGRPGPQIDWNMAASTVAVLGILGVTVPAGMGLVRIRSGEQTVVAPTGETWAQEDGAVQGEEPAPAAHEASWDGSQEWEQEPVQEWEQEPAQAAQEWEQEPVQEWDQAAQTTPWGGGASHQQGQLDGVAMAEAGTRTWVAGRNLRCPDCSTVVTTGFGMVPICPNCDFGADYNGPAAPPVPARAVPY